VLLDVLRRARGRRVRRARSGCWCRWTPSSAPRRPEGTSTRGRVVNGGGWGSPGGCARARC